VNRPENLSVVSLGGRRSVSREHPGSVLPGVYRLGIGIDSGGTDSGNELAFQMIRDRARLRFVLDVESNSVNASEESIYLIQTATLHTNSVTPAIILER
jgi:hypothetical protein